MWRRVRAGVLGPMLTVSLALSCGRTSRSDVDAPSVPRGQAGTPAPTRVEPAQGPNEVGRGGAPSTAAAPTPGGAGPSSAPMPSAGGGFAIAPSALAGCRAPDEPGCAQCCWQTPEGCTTYSGEADWSRYPNVDPWYNHVGSLDGACPADCAVCASCSEQSERALLKQGERPECKCDAPGSGSGGFTEDPCIAEESCECYCEEHGRLTELCPAASDAPFAPKCDAPLEFTSNCSFKATCEALGCGDGLSPFGDDGCRHFCHDSSDCGDGQRCRFTAIVNECGGGGSEIEGCTLHPDGSCDCTATDDCTAPDVCVDAARYPEELDCDISQVNCGELNELSNRLFDVFLGDASAEKVQAVATCRAATHERQQTHGCIETP